MSPTPSPNSDLAELTASLRCAAVVSLMACVGCAATGPSIPVTGHSVELTGTAFFPQNTNQCGPAALTTVLLSSGVQADYDRVAERIFLPDRGGSLQLEIISAARAFDRLPVRIPTNAAAIVDQLNAGRPVLVMQNLGLSLIPLWHYAVVVGYQAEADQFVLRSGQKRRHQMTRRKFLKTWQRAQRWALVLMHSSEEISAVQPDAYLEEAAVLETLGRYTKAEAAYRQAAAHWPDLTLAAFGVANSLHGQGDLDGAQSAYRTLLSREPDNLAARNNLAQTLAELGCTAQAIAVIDEAPVTARGQMLYPYLAATRQEIASGAVVPQRASAAAPHCEVPARR